MRLKPILILTLSHTATIFVGFFIGIYALPIITAPIAPSSTEIERLSSQQHYRAEFIRDLAGSDTFHWGEGKVTLGEQYITLLGEIAPGPDYKLYLSPRFVETKVDFQEMRPFMVIAGDVKTFNNFAVPLAPGVDLHQYNTVIVWCESFGQFITSAKYR